MSFVGDVAQAEADGDDVEMVVRGERLGIGLYVETLLATPDWCSLSRPTFSMESLMSARTTWPVSPTMRENLAVKSCAASQIQHLLSF